MFSPMVAIRSVDQLANGALLVAEWLVVQADLRKPLLELAVDDLGADRVGLLLRCLVGQQLGPLRLEVRFRDAVRIDVERGQTGNLDGEVSHQSLEFVGHGHEVGFAIDLDQDAHPAAGVDVARDQSLPDLPADFLRGRSQASLAEDRRGLLEIAAGLLEGSLAVHEPGAGSIAQLLDEAR